MKSLFNFNKKITVIVILSFILMQGIFSQGITSISIQPQNPTTLDNIVLNADVWIHSGPCWMDSSSISTSGQNLYVNGYYNSGMLAVICGSLDYITLGYLQSGTYSLTYYLHHPDYTAAKDSMSITFIVSPMVTVENKEIPGVISIFPNPADDRIHIDTDEFLGNENIQIDIFSSSGKLVEKIIEDGSHGEIQINTSTLPSRLYLIIISDNGSRIGSAKVNIVR